MLSTLVVWDDKTLNRLPSRSRKEYELRQQKLIFAAKLEGKTLRWSGTSLLPSGPKEKQNKRNITIVLTGAVGESVVTVRVTGRGERSTRTKASGLFGRRIDSFDCSVVQEVDKAKEEALSMKKALSGCELG